MTEHSLIIEYDNARPIDLILLAGSLAAFGDQFKRFVTDQGGVDGEARLFVREIRPGSVIAELIELGQAAQQLWDGREYIAPFAPVFREVVDAILHLKPLAYEVDKPTVRNISNIYAPISAQSGSQINLIDNRGGTMNIIMQTTPADAATIGYNARHLLNSDLPDEQRFTNEPMILFQLRDAPSGKAGDMAIIDRFSPKPMKLNFASDAVKAAILHEDGNPFERVFWVDGAVKTAGDKVVGYTVTSLIDAQPKED